MDSKVSEIANESKGFLAVAEGRLLHEYVLRMPPDLPALEIGSYCGKSSLYLAAACKQKNSLLFAVDHHQGSEEHAPGEAYYDEDLAIYPKGPIDSFRTFRQTLKQACLDSFVIPLVASSAQVSRFWTIPLGFVFIDGGHSEAAAQKDYEGFAKHIVSGAFLAIHDVFPNPNEGGQAPYHIYQRALQDDFVEVAQQDSLRILKKKSAES